MFQESKRRSDDAFIAGSESALYDALIELSENLGRVSINHEDDIFEAHVGSYIKKIPSTDPTSETYLMTDAGWAKLKELENENA